MPTSAATTTELYRVCRYCDEPKRATSVFFSVKDRSTGRLSGYCRICEAYRERNQLMKPRPIKDAPTKVCNVCKVEKPRDDFYGARWRKGAVNSRCKKCDSKKSASIAYRKIRQEWAVRLYRYAKCNRLSRGAVHERGNITPEYLNELYLHQAGYCYWTGVELSLGMGSLTSISLDRLDNGVGYVKGNVVLTTRGANFARNNAGAAEFEEFIRRIKEV